jgi:hypothetical protein
LANVKPFREGPGRPIRIVSIDIKGFAGDSAGRSGGARTCDPRFWSTAIVVLSLVCKAFRQLGPDFSQLGSKMVGVATNKVKSPGEGA